MKKLRDADAMLSGGKSLGEVLQVLDVSEVTYHRWRNQYGGMKNGLSMDRLSCHLFKASFWRLLLHVAAYDLLNAFRDLPETPAKVRRAQPQTWRCRVIKVAVRITESSRRLVIELPAGRM